MSINEPQVSNVSCGEATAQIVFVGGVVSGGAGNISIEWSNGETNSNLSNLSAGAYTISVTDANGCTASKTIDVYPSLPSYPAGIIKSCKNSSTGSISMYADLINGEMPIFAWTVPFTQSANSCTLENLGVGQYCVTITYPINKCTFEKCYDILLLDPDPIVVVGNVKNTCAGQSSGSITLSVTGGTGAYRYAWSTGPASGSAKYINNLSAGNYSVTVSDNCGNATTQSFVIVPLGTDIIASHEIKAVNETTQKIDLTVNGPYDYTWYKYNKLVSQYTTVGHKQDLQGALFPGKYYVQIRDGNGCFIYHEVFECENAKSLSIDLNMVNTASCATTMAVNATVIASGNFPYKFSWYPLNNTDSIVPIKMDINFGNYFTAVRVTDNCGFEKNTAIDKKCADFCPEPDFIGLYTNKPFCYTNCFEPSIIISCSKIFVKSEIEDTVERVVNWLNFGGYNTTFKGKNYVSGQEVHETTNAQNSVYSYNVKNKNNGCISYGSFKMPGKCITAIIWDLGKKFGCADCPEKAIQDTPCSREKMKLVYGSDIIENCIIEKCEAIIEGTEECVQYNYCFFAGQYYACETGVKDCSSLGKDCPFTNPIIGTNPPSSSKITLKDSIVDIQIDNFSKNVFIYSSVKNQNGNTSLIGEVYSRNDLIKEVINGNALNSYNELFYYEENRIVSIEKSNSGFKLHILDSKGTSLIATDFQNCKVLQASKVGFVGLLIVIKNTTSGGVELLKFQNILESTTPITSIVSTNFQTFDKIDFISENEYIVHDSIANSLKINRYNQQINVEIPNGLIVKKVVAKDDESYLVAGEFEGQILFNGVVYNSLHKNILSFTLSKNGEIIKVNYEANKFNQSINDIAVGQDHAFIVAISDAGETMPIKIDLCPPPTCCTEFAGKLDLDTSQCNIVWYPYPNPLYTNSLQMMSDTGFVTVANASSPYNVTAFSGKSFRLAAVSTSCPTLYSDTINVNCDTVAFCPAISIDQSYITDSVIVTIDLIKNLAFDLRIDYFGYNENYSTYLTDSLLIPLTGSTGLNSYAFDYGIMYNMPSNPTAFVGAYNLSIKCPLCIDYCIIDSSTFVFRENPKTDPRNTASTIHVYPNPFSEGFTIDVSSPTINNSKLAITDVSGRLVYEDMLPLNKGDNRYILKESQSWHNGFYQVVILSEDGLIQHRAKIIKSE